MPPSSHSSQDQNQFEALSNQDFEILWQIILAAQKAPIVDKLPFRALFEAYDTVLSQYGLDSNHDQVYLRFLFHLGSKKRPGQTLAEVFKAFLADLGFLVEVDGKLEGADGESISRAESAVDEEDEITERFAGRPRTRRASFSSVVGAEEESTRLSRPRDVSRASTSRVVSQAERSRTKRSTAPPAPTKIPQKGQSSNFASTASRPRRLSSPGHTGALQTIQGRNSPQAEFESRSDDRHRRRRSRSSRAPSEPRRTENGESQFSSPLEDDLSSLLSEDLSSHHSPQVQEPGYRLLGNQPAQDAGIARDLGIRSQPREPPAARHNSPLPIPRDYPALEAAATRRDRETLIRQSLELWRNKWAVKKQAKETKRFFDQLERRAVKARNLYLLAKAFTHWAQRASEQIQQTSEARRHILRLRYFSAWREITAVNELKVRRIRLGKFMDRWKQRYVSNFHTESKAIVVYSGNLAKQIYWRWFWAFCNERAPVWRAQQLKKKYFDKWRQNRRALAQRRHATTQAQQISSRRNIFTVWKEKHFILATLAAQTETVHRQRILAGTFGQWRSQLTYEPRARQVSGMADWRIAASTFALLRKRAMLERQAALVNRMRVIRNAWTLWNDRLRCQALGQLIDERVILQALYIWVVRERFKLLHRLTQKRLLQRCLRKLHSHHQSVLAQRENAVDRVRATQKRKLLASTIQYWHNRAQSNLQKQQQALDFARPRATSKALSIMSAKYTHVREIETIATHTAYFLRVTHTLEKWQDAVAATQREKRRIAYAQMRRTVKMNFARRALLYWHDRTAQLENTQGQARAVHESKQIATATTLFTHWVSRTQSLLSTQLQIEQNLASRLASQTMQTWRQRHAQKQTHGETARVFESLHVSKLAYDGLRVMHLKVLDLNSRREVAGMVREWHRKRTTKGLLAVWAEKTLRRRSSGEEDGGEAAEGFDESTLREQRVLDPYTPYRGAHLNLASGLNAFSLATRGPTTTPFSSQAPTIFAAEPDAAPPDLDALVSRREEVLRTSIPAYLSTPSKRANRTRALVERAGSTTPAETPAGGGIFGIRNAGVGGARTVGSGKGAGIGKAVEEGPRRREEDLRVSVLGRSVIGRRP